MKKVITEAEKVIAIELLKGETMREVAEKFGMTTGRVHSIVNRYCSNANRRMYIKIKNDFDLKDGDLITSVQRLPLHLLREYRRYFIVPERDMKATLSTPIESLSELSNSTVNFLKRSSIKTLGGLPQILEKINRKLRVPTLGAEFCQKIGKKKCQEILNIAEKHRLAPI